MPDLNALTSAIIGAAIEVHRELGPGLLESAYRRCLAFELEQRGFEVCAELPVPLQYKGGSVEGEAYRIDLLVADSVIVELKSVEALLKDGIERAVNGLE